MYDDLGAVITTLGIGEAIVTVMNERGAPTPVAWTRLRAPESLMGATDPAAVQASVQASPGYAAYATPVDGPSAAEALGAKMAAAQAAEKAAAEAKERSAQGPARRKVPPTAQPEDDDSLLEEVVKSSAFKNAMNTAARELVRSVFKRRR
jgi:hypothetical protein